MYITVQNIKIQLACASLNNECPVNDVQPLTTCTLQ